MTSASQECIPVLLDVTRWRSAEILGGGVEGRACSQGQLHATGTADGGGGSEGCSP